MDYKKVGIPVILFDYAGSVLAIIITVWLISFLMGAFQPLLVVTGTALAMTPITTIQLATNGSEMINEAGMLASNIAQGAATVCVAVKTRN
ncbi:hypothetical protein [Clostridium gasigenes]|uniref:hypothetical protein n=1 Tax=Clostridium gasigenes TaxID=94869 RepID=UPI0025B73DD8|nr:hypothetical protein [Clostridium gasigenes]